MGIGFGLYMGIGFGLCLWMTVPGIVDASWFVADDANHTPHRKR
jgi:hypothetical protein